jgi:site-specific DNA-methyltransferase (adenine-specific)
MIIHGDCLDKMREMESNSIDFIVCDPPYGLNFMGKHWDNETPNVEIWKEALRVCKPGSMLAAFGGSRTHHHLMIALEQAGWEIRDVIMWLYGQGFPKSLDISKSIDKSMGLARKIVSAKPYTNQDIRSNNFNRKDEKNVRIQSFNTSASSDLAKKYSGYGTALKPAYEPIIIAMKPLDGTFAKNAEKWGVAGINIDESRIKAIDQYKLSKNWDRETVTDIRNGNYGNGISSGIKLSTQSKEGRWPANIILDEEIAEMLDQQTGILKSGSLIPSDVISKNNIYGKKIKANVNYFDSSSGGASRFFYCSKASPKERGKDNKHPTVKPISLMKYILKLLAPPGDPICLDPFAGSGTTLLAAKELGIRCIGIEKEKEYCEISEARLNFYDIQATTAQIVMKNINIEEK